MCDNTIGIHKLVGAIVCVLLILTFFASFLVRALEFRAYAFSLWALSGIVVAIRVRIRSGYIPGYVFKTLKKI